MGSASCLPPPPGGDAALNPLVYKAMGLQGAFLATSEPECPLEQVLVEGEIGLRLELWDQAAPLPADSLGISLGPVGESTTPAASGLGVFSESGPSGSGGSPDPGWNLIWGDGALASPA